LPVVLVNKEGWVLCLVDTKESSFPSMA